MLLTVFIRLDLRQRPSGNRIIRPGQALARMTFIDMAHCCFRIVYGTKIIAISGIFPSNIIPQGVFYVNIGIKKAPFKGAFVILLENYLLTNTPSTSCNNLEPRFLPYSF